MYVDVPVPAVPHCRMAPTGERRPHYERHALRPHVLRTVQVGGGCITLLVWTLPPAQVVQWQCKSLDTALLAWHDTQTNLDEGRKV